MTFLTDLEVADKLNHPFFNGDDVSEIARKKECESSQESYVLNLQ